MKSVITRVGLLAAVCVLDPPPLKPEVWQKLRGYVSAVVLTFAHTLGEFGVVLRVGGNIPGRTKVISIAIYEHVETLQYAQAHVLSAGLLVFSFIVLLSVYSLNRRMPLVRA